jgi:hypothetical protein
MKARRLWDRRAFRASRDGCRQHPREWAFRDIRMHRGGSREPPESGGASREQRLRRSAGQSARIGTRPARDRPRCHNLTVAAPRPPLGRRRCRVAPPGGRRGRVRILRSGELGCHGTDHLVIPLPLGLPQRRAVARTRGTGLDRAADGLRRHLQPGVSRGARRDRGGALGGEHGSSRVPAPGGEIPTLVESTIAAAPHLECSWTFEDNFNVGINTAMAEVTDAEAAAVEPGAQRGSASLPCPNSAARATSRRTGHGGLRPARVLDHRAGRDAHRDRVARLAGGRVHGRHREHGAGAGGVALLVFTVSDAAATVCACRRSRCTIRSTMSS